ncbi:hypothetical protein [Micromonospora globbae]|uniref:hypothetical protein n=1 Tax=Micromonospora globbae TaxID=1894969 RepID=UPI0037930C48
MAIRTWGKLLLTALGVSVLAGAGQLGVAYGFGIVRLTGAFTGATVNQWPAQLVWVAWFAANAAVAGAVLAGRLARRGPVPATTGRHLAVGAAAALGATAVAPLCMQPARAAELISVDPVFAVGICAVLGAVVGAGAAIAVLLNPPLGWNVAAVAGAVWLLALLSALPSLGASGPLRTVRLGVLEPTWLDADAAQRLSLFLLPIVALLAGASTAGLARWRGQVPLVSGATGVAGPVLVAFAYLTAGPGDAVDRYQTTPYYGALIAVAAGALGAAAAALLRWPAGTRTTGAHAITPSAVLPPLPAGPALPPTGTRPGQPDENADPAGADLAVRPTGTVTSPDALPVTGLTGPTTARTAPVHWDWPETGSATRSWPADDRRRPLVDDPASAPLTIESTLGRPDGTASEAPDAASGATGATPPAAAEDTGVESSAAEGTGARRRSAARKRTSSGPADPAPTGSVTEATDRTATPAEVPSAQATSAQATPAQAASAQAAPAEVPSAEVPWAAEGSSAAPSSPSASAAASTTEATPTEGTGADAPTPRPRRTRKGRSSTSRTGVDAPAAATATSASGPAGGADATATAETSPPTGATSAAPAPTTGTADAAPSAAGTATAGSVGSAATAGSVGSAATAASVDVPATHAGVDATAGTAGAVAADGVERAAAPEGHPGADAPARPSAPAPDRAAPPAADQVATTPPTGGRVTAAPAADDRATGDDDTTSEPLPSGTATASGEKTAATSRLDDDPTAGTGTDTSSWRLTPAWPVPRRTPPAAAEPAHPDAAEKPSEATPRARHRAPLPDLHRAANWEALATARRAGPVSTGTPTTPANGAATDDGEDDAPPPATEAAQPNGRERSRLGLFRRNRARNPETEEPEPLAAQDEEYVDWVAGLGRPLADNEPEQESGRRSLRSTGRHHRD